MQRETERLKFILSAGFCAAVKGASQIYFFCRNLCSGRLSGSNLWLSGPEAARRKSGSRSGRKNPRWAQIKLTFETLGFFSGAQFSTSALESETQSIELTRDATFCRSTGPWVSSALSLIGGVHIGARALLVLNLYGLAISIAYPSGGGGWGGGG